MPTRRVHKKLMCQSAHTPKLSFADQVRFRCTTCRGVGAG